MAIPLYFLEFFFQGYIEKKENNWKTKAEKFQPLKNYFDGCVAWRRGGAAARQRGVAASKKAAREEN